MPRDARLIWPGGGDETYCGSVGRESLFIGGLCDFFEIDAGEEEEDEVH